ncbi:low molecular weight phosphotyrosine protein phosphatase-like [Centruroides vittatus]|uniref:low molecular weight phosphotyrosine protein phosphatase-like n=1 Tax=Centruroides vittatus TaxID=120091 RepID=UPI00350F7843
MAGSGKKKGVLFICLGNICRSPIAEAIFDHLTKEKNVSEQWLIDSAATGDWHIGKRPDKRALACLKKHGIETSHKARQLCSDDFSNFDYIFGMDHNNIEDIKDFAPNSHSANIELLGKYDPKGELIIRDPYFDDGSEGFDTVYEQCLRCCKAFLEKQ